MTEEKKCPNCGNKQEYNQIYPVDTKLVETWGLTPELTDLFNKREGFICVYCGVNKRAQGLAVAILRSKYGYKQTNLKAWVRVANKKNIKVCELNSCHELHKTLANLNNLTYAEYGTRTEQNIEDLSYENETFDLFLHSETLEHVNNPSLAMDECRRVIKKEGIVLFTVPIIWSRRTRQRAFISEKRIIKIIPASYHGYSKDDYLVYREYGNDTENILGAKVVLDDAEFQNYVFMSSKKRSKTSLKNKLRFRLKEQYAIKKINAERRDT